MSVPESHACICACARAYRHTHTHTYTHTHLHNLQVSKAHSEPMLTHGLDMDSRKSTSSFIVRGGSGSLPFP